MRKDVQIKCCKIEMLPAQTQSNNTNKHARLVLYQCRQVLHLLNRLFGAFRILKVDKAIALGFVGILVHGDLAGQD
jgi:hypothetical protein